MWPDTTTGAFTRPRSIGALLGNPRWEKRLLKFLEKTTIGKVGPDTIDDEIRRITRYEEWCNLVEDSESGDEAATHGRNNQARDHNCSTTVARSLRQISAHLNMIISFGVCGFFIWLLLCFCRLFIWLLLLLFSFHFFFFFFFRFSMLWLYSSTFVNSGALIPRRGTAQREGWKISFVRL
jgi:hypothetical protein